VIPGHAVKAGAHRTQEARMIPIPVRRAWDRVAPVEWQMWAHRKADYDWRPSRLIAQRLPRSVVYWTVIRAGVEAIRSDEIVPEVPFCDVLQRTPRCRSDRRPPREAGWWLP
jgi:hypothetical protein